MKKSLGILRNRTSLLDELRKESRKNRMISSMPQGSRFSRQRLSGVKPQIQMTVIDHFDSMKKAFIQDLSTVNTIDTPKPVWIVYFEQCQMLLRGVQELRKEMLSNQNKRLTCIKVSEEKGYEMRIYDCAKQATARIKKCQSLLDLIKKEGQSEPPSHAAQSKVCSTVCFRLASDIQEATKQLRMQQKSFVEQRKQFQVTQKASFLDLAVEQALSMGRGFEEDLIEDEAMKDLEERNEEIKKIVQSIYQLNDIYKEVHQFVVIQGSLLDRIDFNIEASKVAVESGLLHLTKANKRQKKTHKCGCRVMTVLFVANVILLIILCAKWFS